MREFDDLIEVTRRLHGPNGCPWDQTQTFKTMQVYVLEEAHEVIDAVDGNQNAHIIEELGDLLYTVVFYAMIAEKDGRFRMEDILRAIREKLVRRHPHVFEGRTVAIEEVMQKWEKIKSEEKSKKTVIEGIPATLPALARAQKVVKKVSKTRGDLLPHKSDREEGSYSEAALGEALLEIVVEAEAAGIDAESALRRRLSYYENRFLEEEKR